MQVEAGQKGKKIFRLPHPDKREFSIIDFSPNGRSLLLEGQITDGYPNLDYRDVEVLVTNLSNSEIHWVNVWDLFGWRDCDATVESQGFASDGKLVLRPRPAVWSSHRRPNCVTAPGLYATGLQPNSAQKLPDDTTVKRYGKAVHSSYEPCQTDPDIIGACFKFHGRLSFWNGTPSARIWRIGTKRILGVRNEILPKDVNPHMDFGVEAFGNFTVCPFTEERPGEMQMVCVEAVDNVVYRKP
ncbi:MAG: hypothetical protein ABSG54_12805 [Terriglobia bacterium]